MDVVTFMVKCASNFKVRDDDSKLPISHLSFVVWWNVTEKNVRRTLENGLTEIQIK